VDLVSNTAASRSIFTGATRSVSRAGDRMRIALATTAASDRETYSSRAALKSLRAALRGMGNRCYVFDPSYAIRGSFPAAELIPNNDFSNGTNGWNSVNAALTVSDRVMRVTATTPAANVSLYQSIALPVLYAPFVLRSMIMDGAQSAGRTIGVATNGSIQQVNDYQTLRGLRTASFVAVSNSPQNQYPAVFADSSGFSAGAYVSVPWCSLSRCAFVDNAPNQFTQSDAIDHADWTKLGSTVDANAFTTFDGSVTGERIREDTSTGSHSVHQDETKPAAAEEWCLAGAFRIGSDSNARTRVCLRVQDTSTTDFFQAIFDVSGGTVVSTSTTGVAANARSFIRSLGSGWWYCAVVGTTDTETTVRGRVLLVQSGTTVSYTGVTTGDIGVGRMAFAKSSTPIRLGQTTTVTDSDGVPQTGSSLYLKGLPVSINGLVLPGDLFEIPTSGLHRATTPLNSDAASLGYLQFEPNLRSAGITDNTPVIFQTPMARCVLADNEGGWSDEAGGLSDFDFVFEESLDA